MKRRRSLLGCSSPFKVTAVGLVSFLALVSPATQQLVGGSSPPQVPFIQPRPPQEPPLQRNSFRLKQVLHHGARKYPNLLLKADVPTSSELCLEEAEEECVTAVDRGFDVSTASINIERLRHRSPTEMDLLMSTGRKRGGPVELPSSAWTTDAIKGPNVTDKQTVINLAKMASAAYKLDPDEFVWDDWGGGFNYSLSFGWEKDGLRGHIFATDKNETIVLSLKGTSPAVFDGAETTTNDKVNDNLFFSCCCGQGGSYLWHQVCDCQTATYTCNSTCVVKNLLQEDRYYAAAKHLYNNVTALYPHSDIWLVGHSLGGAVSSLVGLTYGIPVVTYEAPGDALPASRLGLPTPPGYHIGSTKPEASTGGFHFGHTGDPVYMGNCATCTIGGYAMESLCHTGMECRFDTVNDLGFHNYIGNHKIVSVISDVLEVYDKPAKCEVIKDCSDCFNWKFVKSNSSTGIPPTSTTTSTFSATRTETCKTPGWFGCLDESTTSSTIGPTTTTTTTTSTCSTPGWFGCLDETTSMPSTSTSTISTTTTSTCETPGWWGCNDPTTSTVTTTTTTFLEPPITSATSTSPPMTTTTTTQSTTSESTTCKTPGFFWGCWDPTLAAQTAYVAMPKATPARATSAPTPSAEFNFTLFLDTEFCDDSQS